jgi:hypothetical protein
MKITINKTATKTKTVIISREERRHAIISREERRHAIKCTGRALEQVKI